MGMDQSITTLYSADTCGPASAQPLSSAAVPEPLANSLRCDMTSQISPRSPVDSAAEDSPRISSMKTGAHDSTLPTILQADSSQCWDGSCSCQTSGRWYDFDKLPDGPPQFSRCQLGWSPTAHLAELNGGGAQELTQGLPSTRLPLFPQPNGLARSLVYPSSPTLPPKTCENCDEIQQNSDHPFGSRTARSATEIFSWVGRTLSAELKKSFGEEFSFRNLSYFLNNSNSDTDNVESGYETETESVSRSKGDRKRKFSISNSNATRIVGGVDEFHNLSSNAKEFSDCNSVTNEIGNSNSDAKGNCIGNSPPHANCNGKSGVIAQFHGNCNALLSNTNFDKSDCTLDIHTGNSHNLKLEGDNGKISSSSIGNFEMHATPDLRTENGNLRTKFFLESVLTSPRNFFETQDFVSRDESSSVDRWLPSRNDHRNHVTTEAQLLTSVVEPPFGDAYAHLRGNLVSCSENWENSVENWLENVPNGGSGVITHSTRTPPHSICLYGSVKGDSEGDELGGEHCPGQGGGDIGASPLAPPSGHYSSPEQGGGDNLTSPPLASPLGTHGSPGQRGGDTHTAPPSAPISGNLSTTHTPITNSPTNSNTTHGVSSTSTRTDNHIIGTPIQQLPIPVNVTLPTPHNVSPSISVTSLEDIGAKNEGDITSNVISTPGFAVVTNSSRPTQNEESTFHTVSATSAQPNLGLHVGTQEGTVKSDNFTPNVSTQHENSGNLETGSSQYQATGFSDVENIPTEDGVNQTSKVECITTQDTLFRPPPGGACGAESLLSNCAHENFSGGIDAGRWNDLLSGIPTAHNNKSDINGFVCDDVLVENSIGLKRGYSPSGTTPVQNKCNKIESPVDSTQAIFGTPFRLVLEQTNAFVASVYKQMPDLEPLSASPTNSFLAGNSSPLGSSNGKSQAVVPELRRDLGDTFGREGEESWVWGTSSFGSSSSNQGPKTGTLKPSSLGHQPCAEPVQTNKKEVDLLILEDKKTDQKSDIQWQQVAMDRQLEIEDLKRTILEMSRKQEEQEELSGNMETQQLRAKIFEQQGIINQISSEKTELQNLVSEVTQATEQYKQEAEIQNKLATQSTILQQQNSGLQNLVDRLEEEKVQLKGTCGEAQLQIDALRIQLDQVDSERQKMEVIGFEARQMVENLKVHLEQTEEKASKATADLVSAADQNKILAQNLEKAKSQSGDLQNSLDECKLQNVQLHKVKTDLELESDTIRHQADLLSSSVSENKKVVQQCLGHIQYLQNLGTNMERERDTLHVENNTLKVELEKANTQIRIVQSSVPMEEKCKKLLEEVSRLQFTIGDKDKIILDSTAKIKYLENFMQNREKTTKDITQKYYELEEKYKVITSHFGGTHLPNHADSSHASLSHIPLRPNFEQVSKEVNNKNTSFTTTTHYQNSFGSNYNGYQPPPVAPEAKPSEGARFGEVTPQQEILYKASRREFANRSFNKHIPGGHQSRPEYMQPCGSCPREATGLPNLIKFKQIESIFEQQPNVGVSVSSNSTGFHQHQEGVQITSTGSTQQGKADSVNVQTVVSTPTVHGAFQTVERDAIVNIPPPTCPPTVHAPDDQKSKGTSPMDLDFDVPWDQENFAHENVRKIFERKKEYVIPINHQSTPAGLLFEPRTIPKTLEDYGIIKFSEEALSFEQQYNPGYGSFLEDHTYMPPMDIRILMERVNTEAMQIAKAFPEANKGKRKHGKHGFKFEDSITHKEICRWLKDLRTHVRNDQIASREVLCLVATGSARTNTQVATMLDRLPRDSAPHTCLTGLVCLVYQCANPGMEADLANIDWNKWSMPNKMRHIDMVNWVEDTVTILMRRFAKGQVVESAAITEIIARLNDSWRFKVKILRQTWSDPFYPRREYSATSDIGLNLFLAWLCWQAEKLENQAKEEALFEKEVVVKTSAGISYLNDASKGNKKGKGKGKGKKGYDSDRSNRSEGSKNGGNKNNNKNKSSRVLQVEEECLDDFEVGDEYQCTDVAYSQASTGGLNLEPRCDNCGKKFRFHPKTSKDRQATRCPSCIAFVGTQSRSSRGRRSSRDRSRDRSGSRGSNGRNNSTYNGVRNGNYSSHNHSDHSYHRNNNIGYNTGGRGGGRHNNNGGRGRGRNAQRNF